MKIKKSKKQSKKIIAVVVVAVLVVVACVAGYLYWQNKEATNREQQYGSSNTRPTEDVPKTTTKNQSSSQSSSVGSSKDPTPTPATTPNETVTPNTPVGTFVSNHRPNLSGSPAPNTMNSTCSTTPGAKCTIQFSNGSSTLSLPEKTTDGNGNVSWDWKLQDINIGKGLWTVKAVAKNGSKTAESTDPIKLEVGP